jgi:hypothetical protein
MASNASVSINRGIFTFRGGIIERVNAHTGLIGRSQIREVLYLLYY